MAQQTAFPSELDSDAQELYEQRQDAREKKVGGLTIPLSELAQGKHALIARMKANPQICYLQCMGFTQGAHVEMIRRISGGALSVYRVEDADVALRREAAAMISVRMEG